MILLLFVLAGLAAADNDCPTPAPTVTCSSKVLVVFDATNTEHVDDIDFQFSAFLKVLPQLNTNNGQQIGFTFQGGKNANVTMPKLMSNYDDICNQFQIVQLKAEASPEKEGDLLTMFQQIYATYGNTLDYLVLYTSDRDPNDIDFAADYKKQFLPNMKVFINALEAGNYPWEDFPYMAMIYAEPYYVNNQTLANCIAGATCGSLDKCFGIGRHFFLPPTPSPPPPTLDPTVYHGDGCSTSCELNKINSDVVIAVENSIYTGKDGLQTIQNFIKTAFAPFNVKRKNTGSSDAFYMMVGTQVYSKYSIVKSPLGSASSDDLANLNLPLPLDDDNQTDVQGALSDAKLAFDGYNNVHRPNAARVIVFFVTNYVQGFYSFPYEPFQDFIHRGGKIIVYQLMKPGMNSYVYDNIVPNMYHIYSTDSDAVQKFQAAICAANCFCQDGSYSYNTDPLSLAPTAGCYFSYNNALANYATATNKCKANGGYVAEGNDLLKSNFLRQLNGPTPMYQGMTWDSISGSWMWNDGRPLDNSKYAPWSSGSDHTSGKDCAIVNAGKWLQTDCRNAYSYVCQISPCDTSKPCSPLK